ncbi:MAG: FimV/HubP family polar landmark protein, partial [Burkholderiales bacterium]
ILSSPVSAAAEGSLDLDLDASSQMPDVIDLDASEAAEEVPSLDLAFDLGGEPEPAPEAPATIETFPPLHDTLVLDLGAQEPGSAPPPSEEKIASDDFALDLDFDLPESAATKAAGAAARPPFPEMEYDSTTAIITGGLPIGEETRIQEAATKLDLAKAYLEMGDKEGAREVLEEVIKDGTPEQQENARKLLSTVG